MSVEDGKDVRRILWHEKEHMAIKEKRRMLKYQAATFRNELTKQRKAYQKLLDGQEARQKSYQPMFETIAELDEEYEKGEMDNSTYMSQRSKIWQVYSDRGHINNIKWLEEELAFYERRIEALEAKMKELSKVKDRYRPSRLRRRKTIYERNRRRKIRKKELEERWKKYGIG